MSYNFPPRAVVEVELGEILRNSANEEDIDSFESSIHANNTPNNTRRFGLTATELQEIFAEQMNMEKELNKVKKDLIRILTNIEKVQRGAQKPKNKTSKWRKYLCLGKDRQFRQ